MFAAMRVDLRSDTMTLPTPEMRRAMADAELGDDVWGEDPTAQRLEEEAAALLGKERALFVPTGTMANQIAIHLHTRPGDAVIIGEHAHVALYEAGAAAAISGVQFVIAGRGGLFEGRDLEAFARTQDHHPPRARLVAIENTHNRAGGRVWPRSQREGVAEAARRLGFALHVDGARLCHAALACGEPEAALVASYDTVSLCFSKGLGAPVGSVLAGSRAAIEEARFVRKRLGGGMRQVGVLCAAALHALHHHRARLVDDHRRAAALAQALARDGRAEVVTPETNIVLFTPTTKTATDVVAAARAQGVLVAPFGERAVRAVVHLGIDDAAIAHAIDVLARALA